MKKLIWLCLFSLCVVPAVGQRRGGFGGSVGRGGFGSSGFGHGGFERGRFPSTIVIGRFNPRFGSFNNFSPFGELGLPPLGPIPPLGGSAPFFTFHNRFSGFGSSAFFPSDFPLFLGGYDSGYPSSPSIVIIQPPAPQMIVEQAPREVIQAVIHDYKELPAAAPAVRPATVEESTFVIALNDGSRLAASAVWVQDSTVHYIDADDRYHEVPLTSIDRQSTRRLNLERNLDLRLPAPSSRQ